MFSGRDLIDIAIKIEENGEKVFRDSLQKISNPSLALMLQWLADEELRHAQWFSELKEKTGIMPDDPKLEEIGAKMLRDVLGNQAFSLNDMSFSTIDATNSLLEHAIEFERDTVLFFEMIQPLIQEGESADTLNKIIQEERLHIQTLEKFLEKGVTDPGAGNINTC